MKTAIIGGGPAGLYFAILMKKQRPAADITVYERNRADDTFGFGVVFSDATLDNFENYDPPSYRRITQRIRLLGRHRDPLQGQRAPHRRQRLLRLLAPDAAADPAGARRGTRRDAASIEADVDDESLFADADLVVVADGINSRFRERYRGAFPARGGSAARTSSPGWARPSRSTPSPSSSRRRSGGRSSPMPTSTRRAARPGCSRPIRRPSSAPASSAMSEAESRRAHGADLRLVPRRPPDPHQPLDLAQLPDDPQQALGHGQQGAARRRQGDGAFLHRLGHQARDGGCHRALRGVPARAERRGALALYETGRREEVEKTQHAADVSLVWFEHVARFWDFDPVQFAFGVMTRAKAITYDNLRLRAPDFVDEVDRTFARQVRQQGFDVSSRRPSRADVPAFPAARDGRCRTGSSCRRWTCTRRRTACPDDWHLVHYGSRATGGAGLVFTEMTCVSPEARITPGCTGLWNDEQEAAWRRIVDFVHANSAREVLPAARPCRAARARRSSCGRASTARSSEGAWDVVLRLADPLFPRQPGAARSRRAPTWTGSRRQFVRGRAARRARRLRHARASLRPRLPARQLPLAAHQPAHGRIWRLAREPPALPARGVRRHARASGRRTSRCRCASRRPTGPRAASPATIRSRSPAPLRSTASTSSTSRPGQTVREARPIYGRMFQTPFSDQIRNEARVATMCVGNITAADQVNTILAAGRADLVALGRPHLVDPSFTMKAAAWYGAKDIHCPPQYLRRHGPGLPQQRA